MANLENSITLKDDEVKLLKELVYNDLLRRDDDDSKTAVLLSLFNKFHSCLKDC